MADNKVIENPYKGLEIVDGHAVKAPEDYQDPKMLYEALIKRIRKYHPSTDISMVEKAFNIAYHAHEGQFRKSGEAYIIHPLWVGIILADLELDKETIVAGILHDVVEDTVMTEQEITEIFGSEVALLVDGVTKLGQLSYSADKLEAENLRKMFLAMAKDIRVILIKLADRLHNMRTLQFMRPEKQIEKARETMDIYAPIAQRLGISRVKTELDDLSLKYSQPEVFYDLVQQINARKTEREEFVQQIVEEVSEHMKNAKIKAEVKGRVKHFFSIYKKMVNQDKTVDQIYDLFAVRIIVESVKDCYAALGVIHEMYTPIPGRFKDYIAMPKPNMYQSLHTTLMSSVGQPFEIQIRTEEMHKTAEYGIAAHWKYKNEGESSELDKWLAGIKEILDQPDASALEFLDEFKLNLFAKEIRVFTPKGYMRTLPKGATALDFAYDIHTEIGNTCIGAKVNHKLVPMSHKLTSGDQVEILTSDKQKPQREWLDFVVTAKARTHINATFKKYRKEQIRTGITIFEAVVKKLDLPPTSEPLKKVLTDYNLTNKDDLYVELAKNIITEGDLEKVLKKKAENKFIKYWKLQFLWNGKDGEEKKKNDNDVQLDVNSDFVIAPCCNPIPGDDVVGMNIAGTKVTVHKRSCPEAIRLMASFGDKIVPIKWVSHKLMSFLTVIKMTGIDKPGIVSDITALIAKEGKVNMRMIHFDTRDGIFEGFIHLYVHNTADLNNIVSRISQIQGVESVMRVENEER